MCCVLLFVEKLIKFAEMREGGKTKVSNLMNRKQNVFAQ